MAGVTVVLAPALYTTTNLNKIKEAMRERFYKIVAWHVSARKDGEKAEMVA